MPYTREGYLKNKEEILEKHKAYKLKNKEKIKIQNKKYHQSNKERINKKGREYSRQTCYAAQKKWSLKNKKYLKEYRKEYKLKNKEQIRKRTKAYKLKNKEKIKIQDKKYYQSNKERISKKGREYYYSKGKNKKKEYYQSNKKRINKRNCKWVSYRRRTDLNFRLKCNLRSRIRLVLIGKNKSASTMELLGCTIEELWVHLESQFEPWMTRENYGLWHVDHIIPCASFDLTDPAQQRECFYYTNLQPLEAIANIKKGAKIIFGDITSPKM